MDSAGRGVRLIAGSILGSVVYAAAVTALARWPAALRSRGHGGPARPVLVAVVVGMAVVAVVALARAERAEPVVAPRVTTALVLVGFGAAWVAWGLLDQHLLRTFDVAPGSPWATAWDGLFHGVGVLTAGVGTSMMTVPA